MSKNRKRQLPEGEELGVDWERWADGRTWRLRRKRHFPDVDPRLAGDAAMNAAARMGKAVQTTKDRYYPDKYIWLQFADHQVSFDEPCPCGCTRLVRLHPSFARCSECGAELFVSDAGEREVGPAIGLSRLTDVHLKRLEQSGPREVYRGYARTVNDRPVLLIVELKPPEEGEEGQELDRAQALARVAKTRIVPFAQLTDLVDVATLGNRDESDWDLVF